jgi:hypothetical protein
VHTPVEYLAGLAGTHSEGWHHSEGRDGGAWVVIMDDAHRFRRGGAGTADVVGFHCTLLQVNLALKKLPRFRCLPEPIGQHRTTTHLLPDESVVMKSLTQGFNDVQAGRLPEFPTIEWYFHTTNDPSIQVCDGHGDATRRGGAVYFVGGGGGPVGEGQHNVVNGFSGVGCWAMWGMMCRRDGCLSFPLLSGTYTLQTTPAYRQVGFKWVGCMLGWKGSGRLPRDSGNSLQKDAMW